LAPFGAVVCLPSRSKRLHPALTTTVSRLQKTDALAPSFLTTPRRFLRRAPGTRRFPSCGRASSP